MMTDSETPKPKSKSGRPKKNGPGAPWTIRGIHPDVRQIVNQAAKKEGMTAGEWINVYVRELAVEKVKHKPSTAIAKIDEKVITESLDKIYDQLADTLDRIHALENRPTFAQRIFGKK